MISHKSPLPIADDSGHKKITEILSATRVATCPSCSFVLQTSFSVFALRALDLRVFLLGSVYIPTSGALTRPIAFSTPSWVLFSFLPDFHWRPCLRGSFIRTPKGRSVGSHHCCIHLPNSMHCGSSIRNVGATITPTGHFWGLTGSLQRAAYSTRQHILFQICIVPFVFDALFSLCSARY